jgi:CopG antitoxin of type II toxin-antitoxin system
MTARTRLPKFKSEAEERKFWETHDSSTLVDWAKAQRVRLPNLKPTTQTSLIKVWLEEKLSA